MATKYGWYVDSGALEIFLTDTERERRALTEFLSAIQETFQDFKMVGLTGYWELETRLRYKIVIAEAAVHLVPDTAGQLIICEALRDEQDDGYHDGLGDFLQEHGIYIQEVYYPPHAPLSGTLKDRLEILAKTVPVSPNDWVRFKADECLVFSRFVDTNYRRTILIALLPHSNCTVRWVRRKPAPTKQGGPARFLCASCR